MRRACSHNEIQHSTTLSDCGWPVIHGHGGVSYRRWQHHLYEQMCYGRDEMRKSINIQLYVLK